MKAVPICLSIMLLLSRLLAAEQQGTGLIAGRVTDMSSAPVAGASVALISLDRVLQTGSSSDGSFGFAHLQPGTYTLDITSPGFAKNAQSLTVQEGPPGQTLSVVLKVADQPEMDKCGRKMSIKYQPLASTSPNLMGTVRDYATSKSIANVEVKIVSETTGQTYAIIRSDKTGRFTADHLSPDYYTIQFSSSDRAPDELKHVVIPRENQVTMESTLTKRGKLIICQ
jgi:hypothetical protein